MQTVDQETYREHEIKIHFDENSESPRVWDNCAHMVCFHKRYNLGDKTDFKTPEDFEEFCESPESSRDEVIRLPIYMYDHSGITINTTGFSCPWDSGQLGFIYMTYGEIIKEFNHEDYPLTRIELIKKAQDRMRSEVEIYDQFLRGQVYGFVIEGKLCNDSAWGYYGDVKDLIKECRELIDFFFTSEEKAVQEMQLTFAL